MIPALRQRLLDWRRALGRRAEFILVNDGSRDGTERLLDAFAREESDVKSVHLSRNFGHQQAVSAGLSVTKGDYVAIIDGDLQDPPEEITRFLAKLEEGYDVVYAVRRSRKEGWLKRSAYSIFYRLLSRLSSIDIPLDSGDFCLMRRVVVDQINGMRSDTGLWGAAMLCGIPQTGMDYARDARASGVPKYTLWKLMELAADGIFTFSAKPLRLATMRGFCTVLIALGYSAYIVLWRFFSDERLPGFASTIVVVLYLGSVQLFCVGILGEYIGRIHDEVKRRPGFIISRVTCKEEGEVLMEWGGEQVGAKYPRWLAFTIAGVFFVLVMAMIAGSPDKYIYDEIYYYRYAKDLSEKGMGLAYLRELIAPPGPLHGIVHHALSWATGLRPIPMRVVTNGLCLAAGMCVSLLSEGGAGMRRGMRRLCCMLSRSVVW